jgi:hypothetical protein
MNLVYGLATVSQLIGLVILVAIVAAGVFCVIHCARTREDAFRAAGKWQKNYWLIALVVCTLLPFAPLGPTGLVISAIGILIYLLDTKPKIDEVLRPRY